LRESAGEASLMSHSSYRPALGAVAAMARNRPFPGPTSRCEKPSVLSGMKVSRK